VRSEAKRHGAIDRLCDTLRPHHPDYTAFTVVSMSGAGRDSAHYLLHRELGGLMPAVLEFDDYKSRRIAEKTGRVPISEDEAFVRFHATHREHRKEKKLPPPTLTDTERLMQFLSLIARFSVTEEELGRLDRIGPEQRERIAGFFSVMVSFREALAKEDRFYSPFEEQVFAELSPRENELFVGLPVMTPAHERFFSRIPEKSRFIDAPLFGPAMPEEPPDYDSALSLIRRLGVPEERAAAGRVSFSELEDRPAMSALVSREIEQFLGRKGEGGQLFIVVLDEALSFYLWQMLLRPLGDTVNFVPWVPFSPFTAAHRLMTAIEGHRPLVTVRRELTAELADRWHGLDDAERSAFEAAVSLIDEIERLRPLMGNEWELLAKHLIAAKKLHLPGKRTAPVQVVGLGNATGIPYERALILPMDRDIFPRKPFNGPFLNLVHVPRIYKAQFEADDLLLRQFLSFGHSAHISARYDKTAGEAPSPHFAFLSVEFGEKPVKRTMQATPFVPPSNTPSIENNDDLRRRLENFEWSFSSLPLFLSCPFRFVIEEIEKIEPPACFEDEDSVNMAIGLFLHEFFASLKDRDDPLDCWGPLFDERWESDTGIAQKVPDRAVRKAIVRSYLDEIAGWERESGDPVLFSKSVTETEFSLKATFGGKYRLTGRIDRLQERGGRKLVADLKYKDGIDPIKKDGLIAEVEDPNGLNDHFQLLFYVHLLVENGHAKEEDLDAAYILLRNGDREKYVVELPAGEIERRAETLDALARRLDHTIALERFTPNYRAAACSYCSYKAICLRPDLYCIGRPK